MKWEQVYEEAYIARGCYLTLLWLRRRKFQFPSCLLWERYFSNDTDTLSQIGFRVFSIAIFNVAKYQSFKVKKKVTHMTYVKGLLKAPLNSARKSK